MANERHAEFNLKITQGDNLNHPLVFTDANGDPVDISADEFRYTCRASYPAITLTDDSDALIVLDSEQAAEMTIDDSGTGTDDRLTLHFVSAQTLLAAGDYYHDIWWVPDGGVGFTAFRGILTIEERVTVRTTEDA